MRVRRMQAHLTQGLSAAEAARAVLGEDIPAEADFSPAAEPHQAPATASALSIAFQQALDAFDEPAAQAVLDRLMSDLSLPTALRDVVVPYLTELGERWERGTAPAVSGDTPPAGCPGRAAGRAGPGLGQRARSPGGPGLPFPGNCTTWR